MHYQFTKRTFFSFINATGLGVHVNYFYFTELKCVPTFWKQWLSESNGYLLSPLNIIIKISHSIYYIFHFILKKKDCGQEFHNLVREACSQYWLIQRLVASQRLSAESKQLSVHLYQPLQSPRLREHHSRRGRKNLGASKWGRSWLLDKTWLLNTSNQSSHS